MSHDKKTPRKPLHLDTETLRVLQSEDIEHAVGGAADVAWQVRSIAVSLKNCCNAKV